MKEKQDLFNYNTFVRLRAIEMLKYYLKQMEMAVVANKFSDISYFTHMIQKEKEVLGLR